MGKVCSTIQSVGLALLVLHAPTINAFRYSNLEFAQNSKFGITSPQKILHSACLPFLPPRGTRFSANKIPCLAQVFPSNAESPASHPVPCQPSKISAVEIKNVRAPSLLARRGLVFFGAAAGILAVVGASAPQPTNAVAMPSRYTADVVILLSLSNNPFTAHVFTIRERSCGRRECVG